MSRFVVDRCDGSWLDIYMEATTNPATTPELLTLWGEFNEVFISAIGRSESGRMLAATGMDIIEAELVARGLVLNEDTMEWAT